MIEADDINVFVKQLEEQMLTFKIDSEAKSKQLEAKIEKLTQELEAKIEKLKS